MSVLVSAAGGRKRLTLNRPERRNALNAEIVERMIEVVAESELDGTRLLEIAGAGRNTCAGFDMSDFDTQSEGDLLWRFVRIEQLLQAIHHAPFHTMALAHGNQVGAGADLILACRTRIGSSDATFEMPGAGFGIVLGTRRLAAAVGNRAAGDLLAGRFDSETAVRNGFLHQVAEPAEWGAATEKYWTRATAWSPVTDRVILDVLRSDTRARDLADLVESAVRPGLKQRISAYIAGRKGGPK